MSCILQEQGSIFTSMNVENANTVHARSISPRNIGCVHIERTGEQIVGSWNESAHMGLGILILTVGMLSLIQHTDAMGVAMTDPHTRAREVAREIATDLVLDIEGSEKYTDATHSALIGRIAQALLTERQQVWEEAAKACENKRVKLTDLEPQCYWAVLRDWCRQQAQGGKG